MRGDCYAAAMDRDVLDCQECGACCHSNLASSVRVTGDDHARLGDLAESLTVFIGNRCYMRLLGTHCVANTRDVDGRFGCSSYDRRPDVCRDLERGSSACRAERFNKLARTLVTTPRSRRW